MLPNLGRLRRRAGGFGLVEVMVGMVIGMLAVIIIMQVFAIAEGRKRTTTSGAESQSEGVMALYQLQRDIRQGGYGFSAPDLFGCNLTWKLAGTTTSITTAVPMAPLLINPSTSIVPAGDSSSDTVLVMYGNTNGEPQGNVINSVAGTAYSVQMPSAFAVNDWVIAAPGACGATTLVADRISAVGATTVTVATGASGSTLYNLGSGPSLVAYAVRGGNLTMCDYTVNDCGVASSVADPSKWVPVANNVVSLKAQYGHDAAAVSASGTRFAVIDDTGYDQTTPTTSCAWTRVAAARIALVARSGQYEQGEVTTAAPTWAGSAGSAINLTARSDWKHYRYKVFETVVPIRNVAWMGVPSGC